MGAPAHEMDWRSSFARDRVRQQPRIALDTQTLRLFFNGRLNIAEASVDRFAVNPAKIKARSINVAL